jgi:hypothetical protein
MSRIQSMLSANHIFQMVFNPAYNAHQSFDDYMKYGSKYSFVTDMCINGEYLRSRTNNQYFCVIDKNTKCGEISNYTGDFRKLDEAIKIRKYNPEKHLILRLEFVKNKQYFVEGYQAISVRNPDVTVMDMPLEELMQITPVFEPIPQF